MLLNRSWKLEEDQDGGEAEAATTKPHASWIQHEARFIMAYTLKPICCMLVEVVARDTARLRAKVSAGFATRDRISRAPDVARYTLESEYPGITAGWRKPSIFICRFTYEAWIHLLYCVRAAYCARWRTGEGKITSRPQRIGHLRGGGRFQSLLRLSYRAKACIGPLSLVLSCSSSTFAYSDTSELTSLYRWHFIHASCVFHRLDHCRDFQSLLSFMLLNQTSRIRFLDIVQIWENVYLFSVGALMRAYVLYLFANSRRHRNRGRLGKFSDVNALNFMLCRMFNTKYNILKDFVIVSANDRIAWVQMIAMRLYEEICFLAGKIWENRQSASCFVSL